MAGSFTRLSVAAVLLTVAAWVYWPELVDLAETWSHNERASHGFFVPVFAVVLLVMRRDKLKGDLDPSWWALAPLGGAIGLRLLSIVYYFAWFDQLSMLLVLAGISLALGGWPLLRWSWVAIAFLCFMFPLPGRFDALIQRPLQE